MDRFRLRSQSFGGQVVAALPCANALRLSQAMTVETVLPMDDHFRALWNANARDQPGHDVVFAVYVL